MIANQFVSYGRHYHLHIARMHVIQHRWANSVNNANDTMNEASERALVIVP